MFHTTKALAKVGPGEKGTNLYSPLIVLLLRSATS